MANFSAKNYDFITLSFKLMRDKGIKGSSVCFRGLEWERNLSQHFSKVDCILESQPSNLYCNPQQATFQLNFLDSFTQTDPLRAKSVHRQEKTGWCTEVVILVCVRTQLPENEYAQ